MKIVLYSSLILLFCFSCKRGVVENAIPAHQEEEIPTRFSNKEAITSWGNNKDYVSHKSEELRHKNTEYVVVYEDFGFGATLINVYIYVKSEEGWYVKFYKENIKGFVKVVLDEEKEILEIITKEGRVLEQYIL